MAVRKPSAGQARGEHRGDSLPPLVEWTYEESWEHFDQRAQELLGISGAEFVRRLEQGDYRGKPEDDRVLELALMRVDPPA